MSGFFMLAGTVACDKPLQEICKLLKSIGIESTVQQDELELDNPANLVFRSGFDHEYIVVGDALEEEVLLHECQRLSEFLSQHTFPHELELYNTQNELIHQLHSKSE